MAEVSHLESVDHAEEGSPLRAGEKGITMVGGKVNYLSLGSKFYLRFLLAAATLAP